MANQQYTNPTDCATPPPSYTPCIPTTENPEDYWKIAQQHREKFENSVPAKETRYAFVVAEPSYIDLTNRDNEAETQGFLSMTMTFPR